MPLIAANCLYLLIYFRELGVYVPLSVPIPIRTNTVFYVNGNIPRAAALWGLHCQVEFIAVNCHSKLGLGGALDRPGSDRDVHSQWTKSDV